MRNRFYSSSIGRFISEDPIGLADGDLLFYRYVGNDPVNAVDPIGLSESKIIERGGYRFVLHPGDTMHGGRHWHVYKGKSNKLLGRMALDGTTLTGHLSNKSRKIARKAGLIGLFFNAYGVYDAVTATKAETFENIMDMAKDWPEGLQKELIEDILKKNPCFFEEKYIDFWIRGCK